MEFLPPELHTDTNASNQEQQQRRGQEQGGGVGSRLEAAVNNANQAPRPPLIQVGYRWCGDCENINNVGSCK